MSEVTIEFDSGFQSDIKTLSRKRPGLENYVRDKVARIAQGQDPPGKPIKGLEKERPVFIAKVGWTNISPHNFGRIVHYFDGELMVCFFLYLKGDMSHMPVPEIEKALVAYGL